MICVMLGKWLYWLLLCRVLLPRFSQHSKQQHCIHAWILLPFVLIIHCSWQIYMVSNALVRSSIWYPRLLAGLLYGIQDSWQIFYMVSKALGRLFIWYPKHRSALSRQVSLYSPANTSVSICSSPQENITYEFILTCQAVLSKSQRFVQ